MLKESLDGAKQSLDRFYENNSSIVDEKRKSLACDYLKWIKTKTEIIWNEKDFCLPENAQIKRGIVFWINFGYCKKVGKKYCNYTRTGV